MQTIPPPCSAVCKRKVGSAIVSLGLLTRFINERIFLSLLLCSVPNFGAILFLQPFIQAFIAYLKCQVKSKKGCGLRGTGLRHFFLSLPSVSGLVIVPQGTKLLRAVSRRNRKGNSGLTTWPWGQMRLDFLSILHPTFVPSWYNWPVDPSA